MIGIQHIPLFAVGILARPRAVRPVRPGGIDLRAQPRQHLQPISLPPSLPLLQSLFPAPLVVSPHRLVPAAPQHDTRVRAQSCDLVPRLALHKFRPSLERRLLRVHPAGEHEVLPHEDAQPVALVVESGRFVQTAAPHAQHVHAALGGSADTRADQVIARVAGEKPLGYPVRTLAEDGRAIHAERERASPSVAGSVEDHRAQADTPLPGVEHDIAAAEFHTQFVQRSVIARASFPWAMAARPPQLRRLNSKPDRDGIRARGKRCAPAGNNRTPAGRAQHRDDVRLFAPRAGVCLAAEDGVVG